MTTKQALLLGLSHNSLRRLVRQERWVRTASGLYDARPGPSTFDKRAWGGFLLAGDPAAIGGEAALRLHGLDRAVDQIEVWVPRDRQPCSRPDLVIRRDWLGRLERRRGTLSRIRAEDAVVDVGEHLEAEPLVNLLTEAVRARRVTLTSVARTVESRSRVANRALFRELLRDLEGIESTLEHRYLVDVERPHALPRGVRQVSLVARSRTDVWCDEADLLVELDGRVGHIDRAFRDMHRDNANASRGGITLRYGSADVRGRPCEVARQVAEVLLDRGWKGSPRPCDRCRLAANSGDFARV